MAKTPGQAVLDDIADIRAAHGDAGHRGDMVGLERVLHAEQKPKPQTSEHLSPARHARSKSADNLNSRHREEQTEASQTPSKPAPSFQSTSSKRLRIDAHERRSACTL
jgi:hypothetical protein